MAPQPGRGLALGLGAKISLLTTSLVVTAIVIASVLSFFDIRTRVKREVGARLLAIVETAVSGIDAGRHAEIFGDAELGDETIGDGKGGEIRLFGAQAFLEIRDFLRKVKQENRLPTDIYTFRWPTAQQAAAGTEEPRMVFVVMTHERPYVGHALAGLSEEQRRAVARLYATGEATTTDLYRDPEGIWLSAMAPIVTKEGAIDAVLEVDYRLDMYHRLVMDQFRKAVMFSLLGAAVAVALSLAFVRLLTRPLHALADAMKMVEGGELPNHVDIRSGDEIGYLAERFNSMIDGLRQRDFLKHTLQRYVTTSVVEHLIQNPKLVALHGERRNLTVFFSDIADFSRIAEAQQPETIVALLNEYLDIVTDVIFDAQGTLDKYEGDGIMAFWGAPVHQEDHAVSACRAALAIQGRLKKIRANWQKKGQPPLPTRIGLNTGDCVVGNIGCERRMDYTVIGSTVNMASRLEGANKYFGTEILISQATYERVKHVLLAREIDCIGAPGHTEPTYVYEPLCEHADADEPTRELLARYQAALAAYRRRDWRSARDAFGACLSIRPDDTPSRVLLARVELFSENPPDENWDGAFRLSKG